MNNKNFNWKKVERIGLVGWFTLYLSGAIILFFLLTHVVAIHFVSPGRISAQSVTNDFNNGFPAFIGLGLLILCTIHGLIGFRRMILDLELFGRKGDKYFVFGLFIVGMAVLIYGISLYSKFLLLGSSLMVS